MGFDQFWISPPEFLEFQERTQALFLGRRVRDRPGEPDRRDRPRRVNGGRLAELLQGARRHAAARPHVRAGGDAAERRRRSRSCRTSVAVGVRRPAGSSDRRSRSTASAHRRRHHAAGLRRRRPARRGLASARIDPANRQNRGSHFLYLIGRLADRPTLATARAELDTLLAGWPTSIARRPAPTPPHTPDTKNHRLRSTRCSCRSSAAPGPRSSCCRARWCSCC